MKQKTGVWKDIYAYFTTKTFEAHAVSKNNLFFRILSFFHNEDV